MVKDAVVKVRLDTTEAKQKLNELERQVSTGERRADQRKLAAKKKDKEKDEKKESRFGFVAKATKSALVAGGALTVLGAMKAVLAPIVESLLFEKFQEADELARRLGLATEEGLEDLGNRIRDEISNRITQFTSKIAAFQDTRTSVRAMEIAGANPTAAEALEVFKAVSATKHQTMFLEDKFKRLKDRAVADALVGEMRKAFAELTNP